MECGPPDALQRGDSLSALYRYNPDTLDPEFMCHYRMAPMGRPIGPVPENPSQYLLLTTNAQQTGPVMGTWLEFGFIGGDNSP